MEMETIESSDRTEADFWEWYGSACFITPDFFLRLEAAMGQREMCAKFVEGKLPLIESELKRFRKNQANFLEKHPILTDTITNAKIDISVLTGPGPKEKP
jgi:hypothetical protein